MSRADFVIVGAGSAGCVMAERLSRNPRNHVVLLEAGGSDQRFWVQTPIGYGRLYRDPTLNWCYQTAPDPGLEGRRDYWPRGKVIGGSSSINAMVYIRGHPQDYDDWADQGLPGWGWPGVTPYFDEVENGESEHPNISLSVRDVSRFSHPLARRLIDAGQALQIPFNPDFNSGDQEGVGYYQITTTNKGKRCSAARGFLWPALKRSNLRVVTGAEVDRITCRDGRARSVHYSVAGAEQVLEADAEIILAAGAIGSPMILQRSGIGPAQQLARQGIPVQVANDNVGAHLQDHLGINFYYRATVPTLNQILGKGWRRYLQGLRYLLMGTGPLSLSINQSGGFIRATPEMPRPNLQLYFQALTALNAQHSSIDRLEPDAFPGFSLGLSNTRPKSRGRIELQSADPAEPPAIYPNSFADEADLVELLAGVKWLRQLAATPAFTAVIAEELQPGKDCRSEAELRDDIRARASTVFHPCCTCRMAPSAETGVVDARLKVFGMDALRVADASIFPNITSGNTNAPSMMVGAKGAALLLEDLGSG